MSRLDDLFSDKDLVLEIVYGELVDGETALPALKAEIKALMLELINEVARDTSMPRTTSGLTIQLVELRQKVEEL